MKNKKKGDKVEKEASKIAYYNFDFVDRPEKIKTPMNSNRDLFNFADIVAYNPGEPVRLIQVKTNAFTWKQNYVDLASKLQSKHVICEVWIKKADLNTPSWKFYKFEDYRTRFTEYFETNGVLETHETGKLFEQQIDTSEIKPCLIENMDFDEDGKTVFR